MSPLELPIVIVGPQGAGKTLYARELARTMPGARFIEDDCFDLKKLGPRDIVTTNFREDLGKIKRAFTFLDINSSRFIDGKIFKPRREGSGHQPMPSGRALKQPPRKR